MEFIRKSSWLLISLSISLLSCNKKTSTSTTTKPPPSTELVTMRVIDINGKPCPQMQVNINNGAVQASTDNFGVAQFPVRKDFLRLKSLVSINVSNKSLNINEKRQLPLNKVMKDFAISTSIDYTVRNWATIKQDTSEEVLFSLVNVENSIRELENYLESFLRENPGSSLEKYRDLIRSHQNNLKSIRESFNTLINKITEVKSDIDGNDPKINVNLDKITDNFLAASAYCRGFKERVSALRVGVEEGISNDKKYAFDVLNRVFFPLGQYEIGTLGQNQINVLNNLADQINLVYTEQKRKYPNIVLTCIIHFIGHADGAPVGYNLANELKGKCLQTSEFRIKTGSILDDNHCLSWLRAANVSKLILPKLTNTPHEIKIIGCGSWRATNTKPDDSLRKCVVSCLIRPSGQLDNYDDFKLILLD